MAGPAIIRSLLRESIENIPAARKVKPATIAGELRGSQPVGPKRQSIEEEMKWTSFDEDLERLDPQSGEELRKVGQATHTKLTPDQETTLMREAESRDDLGVEFGEEASYLLPDRGNLDTIAAEHVASRMTTAETLAAGEKSIVLNADMQFNTARDRGAFTDITLPAARKEGSDYQAKVLSFSDADLGGSRYTSPHFGYTDDYLLHTRTYSDKVGGKDTHVVLEIQSDLHQAARQMGGYKEDFEPMAEALKSERLMDYIDEFTETDLFSIDATKQATALNKVLSTDFFKDVGAPKEFVDRLRKEVSGEIQGKRMFNLFVDMTSRGKASLSGIPPKSPFASTWVKKGIERELVDAINEGKSQLAVPMEIPQKLLQDLMRTEGVQKTFYQKNVMKEMQKVAKQIGGEFKLVEDIGGRVGKIERPDIPRFVPQSAMNSLESFLNDPGLADDFALINVNDAVNRSLSVGAPNMTPIDVSKLDTPQLENLFSALKGRQDELHEGYITAKVQQSPEVAKEFDEALDSFIRSSDEMDRMEPITLKFALSKANRLNKVLGYPPVNVKLRDGFDAIAEMSDEVFARAMRDKKTIKNALDNRQTEDLMITYGVITPPKDKKVVFDLFGAGGAAAGAGYLGKQVVQDYHNPDNVGSPGQIDPNNIERISREI